MASYKIALMGGDGTGPEVLAEGVKVMNVADKDKVCAVAIASTGKKKTKKAAPADENQMGLLEEESEEGTLAIDDLDDLDDDLGDEGEATEE